MSYYICPKCSVKMKSYWRLRRHIMEEHSKEKMVSGDVQQIPVVVKQSRC